MQSTDKINTEDILIVYEDEQGEKYYQSIFDLVTQGTFIDPKTGEDMAVVGWKSPSGDI